MWACFPSAVPFLGVCFKTEAESERIWHISLLCTWTLTIPGSAVPGPDHQDPVLRAEADPPMDRLRAAAPKEGPETEREKWMFAKK